MVVKFSQLSLMNEMYKAHIYSRTGHL